MGVPYVPVTGLVGSDLLARRDDMRLVPDPFHPGRRTLVARALRPDVALLHGERADRAGNVSLGAYTDDVILAEASRRVIVSVETVVEAPFGAHPAGLRGWYPIDAEHMRAYAEQARSDETFRAYLGRTVQEVASHADYVARFVPAAWREAQPTLPGLREAGD
jgi:glutaconate CoA-transferase subunit A